jgi:hypothetical protein
MWELYCTVARAEELLGTLPQTDAITDWLALTDDQKTQSLTAATYVLDTLDYKGTKCECGQPQEWPRVIYECGCALTNCDGLPVELELACAVMACEIGTDASKYLNIHNGSGGGGGGGGGIEGLEPFSEVTIGPINVKMKDDFVSINDTLIELLSPFLLGLLDKFLKGVGPVSQGNVRRPSVARVYGVRGLFPAPAYSGRFYLSNGRVRPRLGRW